MPAGAPRVGCRLKKPASALKNGQSLVLGGVEENGRDAFNRLSALCLKASGSLKIIDPKMNLRVSKSTPLRVYKQGSERTKAGLAQTLLRDEALLNQNGGRVTFSGG